MEKQKENNKARNFIIAVLLLIATYILIVILTQNDNSFNTNMPVSNMQNTENNNIKDILKDELYIIQNINEEESGYEINIYYPFTIDDSLNSYIMNKIELYMKDIKFLASGYDKEVKEGKYKLDISFNVTKSDKNYISFIFTVVQDVKFLHPNEYIFVINYDQLNNKILMQEDISTLYPNLYYNLSEYTYTELSQKEEIIEMGAMDLLIEGTKPNMYNFMDLAFKDDKLLVIFEKYQVAPYVLGTFEVEVPISYLNKN